MSKPRKSSNKTGSRPDAKGGGPHRSKRRSAQRRGRRSAKGKSSTAIQRARQWLVAVLAGLAGLAISGAGVWVWSLQKTVVEQFEQRRWDQPSLVYARPLQLDRGMRLSTAQLVFELQAAGYSSADSASLQPGQFRRRGDSVQAQSRAFVFADGLQPSVAVRVKIAEQRVDALWVAGKPATQFRFDPAEIGAIRGVGVDDRKFVPLQAFPPLLITAIQAVEDRQFKHHFGIDWHGFARAVWVNLRSAKLRQGGSTITQQLVRNMYLSHDRKLLRKLNELIMAVALERHFSKPEILESYLNEVYLGQHSGGAIHGFARASEYYFGRTVASLEPQQLALLVGMVRGASWYNPRSHPQRARTRRDLVLELMHNTGLISAAELAEFKSRPLGVTATPVLGRSQFPAFMDMVRRQLQHDYQAEDLQRDGLRVLTTLDPYQQHRAEQAVINTLPKVERSLGTSQLQAGVVVVDPQTGDLLALVGDRQPDRRGFNRALDARRQIGSIIKPFIYLQAWSIASHYTLVSRLDDQPISIKTDDNKIWQPQNYDLRSHGEVSLLSALLQSYNQATVRLGLQLGLSEVAGLLQRLGLLEHNARLHPSLFLGALDATPLQMAAAYQPLAADGYQTELSAVRNVLSGEQSLRSGYPVRIRQLLDTAPVALLQYALTLVSSEGTGRGLTATLGPGRAIASKTGTSNDKRDSWFVGFDEETLAVVWIGRDDNTPAAVTGANAALPVWAALFAGQGMQDIDVEALPGLYWYWVDQRNGLLSSEACPQARVLPFIARSEPTEWSDCS